MANDTNLKKRKALLNTKLTKLKFVIENNFYRKQKIETNLIDRLQS